MLSLRLCHLCPLCPVACAHGVCCHSVSATVVIVRAVTPSPLLLPLCTCCHSVSANVIIVPAVTRVCCVRSLVPAVSAVTLSALLSLLYLLSLHLHYCYRGVWCHSVFTTVIIVPPVIPSPLLSLFYAVACVRCVRSLMPAVSAVTCVIISTPPTPILLGIRRWGLLPYHRLCPLPCHLLQTNCHAHSSGDLLRRYSLPPWQEPT